MEREKFLNFLGEYNNLTIIFYYFDEIPAILKIEIESLEEYDDEIIIRGNNNTYIILQGEPTMIKNEENEEEYVFKNGNLNIGVIIL